MTAQIWTTSWSILIFESPQIETSAERGTRVPSSCALASRTTRQHVRCYSEKKERKEPETETETEKRKRKLQNTPHYYYSEFLLDGTIGRVYRILKKGGRTPPRCRGPPLLRSCHRARRELQQRGAAAAPSPPRSTRAPAASCSRGGPGEILGCVRVLGGGRYVVDIMHSGNNVKR